MDAWSLNANRIREALILWFLLAESLKYKYGNSDLEMSPVAFLRESLEYILKRYRVRGLILDLHPKILFAGTVPGVMLLVG